jgi:hypothetical protein
MVDKIICPEKEDKRRKKMILISWVFLTYYAFSQLLTHRLIAA